MAGLQFRFYVIVSAQHGWYRPVPLSPYFNAPCFPFPQCVACYPSNSISALRAYNTTIDTRFYLTKLKRPSLICLHTAQRRQQHERIATLPPDSAEPVTNV